MGRKVRPNGLATNELEATVDALAAHCIETNRNTKFKLISDEQRSQMKIYFNQTFV